MSILTEQWLDYTSENKSIEKLCTRVSINLSVKKSILIYEKVILINHTQIIFLEMSMKKKHFDQIGKTILCIFTSWKH